MPKILRRRIAIMLSLLAAGCNVGGPDNEAIVDEDVLNSTLLPELPRPVAPLDRRALLQAIDDAAGSFELNANDLEAQAQLVNRQFVLRIPFGCGGAPVTSGPLTVTLRPDGKSMALAASPDIQASSLGEDSRVEEAEGFWIPRPWVGVEDCPTVATPAEAASGEGDNAVDGNAAEPMPAPAPKTPSTSALTERTAGLVQFFTPTDSRLIRREGKAYSAVVPVDDGALPAGGIALRIEGRLRPFPTGRVIRCRSSAAGLRPVCFASIQADRIAFERLADKAILAEWHN